MATTRFIAPRVALVDQNGMISREWFLFLQSFFPSQANNASDDLTLAPGGGDSPALRDELAELRKRVDDMGKGAIVL